MTEIALDDRGFTLGHGLFETVLWANDRLEHWDDHVERMARGCRALRLPAPDGEAMRRAALVALDAVASPPRAAVRLNWSAGSGARGLDPPETPQPVLTVTVAVAPLPKGGVRLATARVRRNDRSPAARLKTLSYIDNVLARAEAREAGAEEALMLNTAGEVACAAAANIFWVRHDEVFTPSLECGVLDGIMRRQVIAACHALGLPLQEVFTNLGRIAGAPMFITNSLVGVRAVDSVDGRDLPNSPLVAAIAKAVSRAPK
ncbi:aminotransferase class IV [Phenylobacterium sp.]|uniref:aminotransferase class IV n=1 Tax=Phenylobacterium sp. TaxID=1871053 RepID=UPI0012100B8E|nr:aminotransferase class IV [Phenylobacterium sp.]TAL34205.1 MAG: 4-amino-4-deoxychorismate lyase [Phenylobacterium sp.]